MTTPTEPQRELSLEPHPRILPMLGEIHLKQWQCVAELVDNSIDSFITAQRAGRAVHNPQVLVTTPASDRPEARLSIVDNGPGMDPDTLENAVRAGWSGNDPIGNLGLFGMGFNIATARLGSFTSVWTTRRDDPAWYGVQIDFDSLIKQRNYRTPLVTRPKMDSKQSGTEVVVTRLKPEQREWFSHARNRTGLGQDLGRVYSAMLQASGRPIGVKLSLNDSEVRGRRHCIWDHDRTVETTRLGPIAARRPFDVRLEDRPFCQRCWQWLASGEEQCRQCGASDAVVHRARRIHGWLGVQRYLHEKYFGIDFLRNGRKIEVMNKELFTWNGDGLVDEKEYPIDDPRSRGRIVGEVHLDHCRVTYTKDRFDRNDPAWDDMIKALRGEGPLRPEKASDLGFRGENRTPLYALYQGFRRSNPKNKRAGGWGKLLVVPDNDRAVQMAEKFYEGEVEYQTDTKWWALVEEADRQAVTQSNSPQADVNADQFWVGADADVAFPPRPAALTEPLATPIRRELPSLTMEFVEDSSQLRWAVRAFEAMENDPALLGDAWAIIQPEAGRWEFLVNPHHDVFRSATLTPADALFAELAHHAADATRDRQEPVRFAHALTGIRQRYATSSRLDPGALTLQAAAVLSQMARSLTRNTEPADALALWTNLPSEDQDSVWYRIIARDKRNANEVLSKGRFLEYAPRPVLRRFFESHPELFMDGRHWDVPYDSLDYGREDLTAAAREQIKRAFLALLTDVIWLAEADTSDLADATRGRLLRAALAVDELESEVAPGDADA